MDVDIILTEQQLNELKREMLTVVNDSRQRNPLTKGVYRVCYADPGKDVIHATIYVRHDALSVDMNKKVYWKALFVDVFYGIDPVIPDQEPLSTYDELKDASERLNEINHLLLTKYSEEIIKEVVAFAHGGKTDIIETVDFIAGVKETLKYLEAKAKINQETKASHE